MRKKSHIILARYLVHESKNKELKEHKYAFYLGSILPDIKPSFLYRKHEFYGTFPHLQERIRQLSTKEYKDSKSEAKYYRKLGEISHYIADYFTFPHNKKFAGGFREHCSYEEELKKQLRTYIKSGKAASRKRKYIKFERPEALFHYVEQSHNDYLKEHNSVEEDITNIVPISTQVIRSISSFAVESGS